MEQVFKFAGVSFHNDKFKFRATNREGYDAILTKEGKTYVNILALPEPMTKEAAARYLLNTDPVKGLCAQQDACQAVLEAVAGKGQKAPKAPREKKVKAAAMAAKPVKTPPKVTKVARNRPVTNDGRSVPSADQLAEIRAKNLATIAQVAGSTKRMIEEENRKAKAEEAMEQIDRDLDSEDPKEFIPKFLHKELGLQ
jgi:pyruvate/2-oxoglutarate dehydrogenase complex dihydrolipoamide acyltransferase (E2) component